MRGPELERSCIPIQRPRFLPNFTISEHRGQLSLESNYQISSSKPQVRGDRSAKGQSLSRIIFTNFYHLSFSQISIISLGTNQVGKFTFHVSMLSPRSLEMPGVIDTFGFGIENEAEKKANGVLTKERTGHSKHPLSTAQR